MSLKVSTPLYHYNLNFVDMHVHVTGFGLVTNIFVITFAIVKTYTVVLHITCMLTLLISPI